MNEIRLTLDQPLTWNIPTSVVSDTGIELGKGTTITFFSGDPSDKDVVRQEGVTPETLISLVKEYLALQNSGEDANKDTNKAMEKLNHALQLLDRRKETVKLMVKKPKKKKL